MVLKKTADFITNSSTNAVMGGVVGAGTVFAAGTLAGAAVPWAMTTFGTVVSGVGTIYILRRPQEVSRQICSC